MASSQRSWLGECAPTRAAGSTAPRRVAGRCSSNPRRKQGFSGRSTPVATAVRSLGLTNSRGRPLDPRRRRPCAPRGASAARRQINRVWMPPHVSHGDGEHARKCRLNDRCDRRKRRQRGLSASRLVLLRPGAVSGADGISSTGR